MTAKPPLTTAERISLAKTILDEDQAPEWAIAHALVAIAELMATNTADLIVDATARGAVAAAEAIGTVLSVVNPGGPIQCGQQCDCHDRLNPGFHCSACDPTGDVEDRRVDCPECEGNGANCAAHGGGLSRAIGNLRGGILPNTIWPCTVKSSGGRSCIHNVGHASDHEDQHGWTWSAAGEHDYFIRNESIDAAHCRSSAPLTDV